MDSDLICSRCGAMQPKKKSKAPLIIGIIVGVMLLLGVILFGVVVIISILIGSKTYSANASLSEVPLTTETSEISEEIKENSEENSEEVYQVEFQRFEDDYLSYEIPMTWDKNEEFSNSSANITAFIPMNSTTDWPSNVNITINGFENGAELANTDYSDEKVQESFYAFLMSEVGTQLPTEAADGEFSVIQIGGHYVYTLAFERQVDDKLVHQTLYTPMGYQYTMSIYATDWSDGENPSSDQVAKHLIETLVIK